MAATNLNTERPPFDDWVLLKNISQNKITPAVMFMQNGQGVYFVGPVYRSGESSLGSKNVSIPIAEWTNYEWQDIPTV